MGFCMAEKGRFASGAAAIATSLRVAVGDLFRLLVRLNQSL
jgi:hypothetical protein